MKHESEEIVSLIESLDHPDKSVVRPAVDLLIALGSRRPEIQETLSRYLQDPCRKKRWPIAGRANDRFVNLVTGFLEASKAESGKLKIGEELVQVNRLLREASQQQESEVQKKGLSLELDLEERLPDVRGDESQLDRVFWNLIGNAIKFTRNGGKVKISSWRDGGTICVAVQDTGVGISQEDLPLLFSQFRRLKGSEKIEGTGLGLFIVKTIIEAHKGTVWAESPEGQGTTFTARIPIQL